MNAGALAMQVVAINRAVTQFGCEFTSWEDVSCTDTPLGLSIYAEIFRRITFVCDIPESVIFKIIENISKTFCTAPVDL